jgi:hypothetical protein
MKRVTREERTEKKKQMRRVEKLSLRFLCGLCVSAVNGLTYIEAINDNC